MNDLFFLMVVSLVFLAIADLIVGVSNDAVNFLNSALGSKAISFKVIMILASLGIAFGAIFSSGMMEVARKGIFNPGEFMFDEIMFIFMAVMITDILLLDFFNSLGMPTSTTISIVFELLGASVAMALIKISSDGADFSDLVTYINTSKAVQIILGILLSVVVAFSVGALVQWISRLLLSYDYEKKAKWVGALFGSIALTSITYFILLKGIKGTSYAGQSFELLGDETIKSFLTNNIFIIIIVSLVSWYFMSFLLIKKLKINIYKVIIGVGTFALALAFAGNDLVNFIGVPIAAWQSYEAWVISGIPANEFSMQVLDAKVPTPTLFLLIAGIIMVLTLWFSSKAKLVVKTSIDLSNQGEIKERFNPNWISRGLVRFATIISNGLSKILPENVKNKIETQFETPVIALAKNKTLELPAFDMVRAAVNLMVAGVLISIATSYKLPLSTTYVTFMVAMGSSLADRAWGRESAVYRVAGVLNVIGGWFFTAIVAFSAAGIIAYLINLGGPTAIAVLLFIVLLNFGSNYISRVKKSEKVKAEDQLKKAESSSVQGVITESAANIANVVKRSNRIYTNAIQGLEEYDLELLRKNKKQIVKLSDEVDELSDNLFYFIKNLDESSLSASNFYLNILGYLKDMTQSLKYISKVSHKHVNNNHKKLTTTQTNELKIIDDGFEILFNNIIKAFKKASFQEIGVILKKKTDLINLVSDKINKQIDRTRANESSPKNTTLYFSLLIETKDLLNATMSMLDEYYISYDKSVGTSKVNVKDK